MRADIDRSAPGRTSVVRDARLAPNIMEATPFQIVGCIFSLEPAAQRIDEFVTQVRRERAVVTAKTARQATFVKLGASDAGLIALACRAADASSGAPLRFGFATRVADRASLHREDGARVSSRSIAQANDLAASARDGEVLLSPQLARLLTATGFAFQSKEVHLPGGRTAVACSLDTAPVDARDTAAADKQQAPIDNAQQAPRESEDLAAALRALAQQADAFQHRQDELDARQGVMTEQLSHAAQQLQAITTQVATLSQALETSRHTVTALETRLARSRDDQQFALDHADRVSDLRAKVEALLTRLEETDGKIALIESRRKTVEEVQTRAEGITHMLEDINVNLEMLGEQRAVIDDVGEKLARLEFTVQEAHSTLRALQREREVAERIEQGIKALRARGTSVKVGAGR